VIFILVIPLVLFTEHQHAIDISRCVYNYYPSRQVNVKDKPATGPPLSHLARNEKFLALEIFLSQNAQRLFKGILREGDINNKATQAQGQVDAASKRRGPNLHPRLKSHMQS